MSISKDDTTGGGSLSFPLVSTTLGSSGAPAYSFDGDSDTGMYSPTGDKLSFSTAGSNRLTLDSVDGVKADSILTASQGLYSSNGNAALPSISFTGDPDTGLFSGGINTIGITCGQSTKALIAPTNIQTTVPFYAASGSSGVPSYSFGSDPDTGMYRVSGAGYIEGMGFSVGGTEYMSISTGNGITTNIPILATQTGFASFPSYSFENAPTCGMYPVSSTKIAISADTSDCMFFESGQSLLPSGSAGSPSLSFDGDSTTGIYSSGSGEIAFSSVGSNQMVMDGSSITNSVQMRGPNGSGSVPTYSFDGDTTTGIYNAPGSKIAFSTAGSTRLTIDVVDGVKANSNLVAGSRFFASNGSAGSPSIGFSTDPNTGFYWSFADEIGVSCGSTQRCSFTNVGFIAATNGTYPLGSSSKNWGVFYANLGSGTGTNVVIDGGNNQLLKDTSDIRLKKNITDYNTDWHTFNQLRPRVYEFKSQSELDEELKADPENKFLQKANINGEDQQYIGLVAQEVEPLYPQVVSGNESNPYGISLDKLVPVLISHIQDLHNRVKQLESNASISPPDESSPKNTLRPSNGKLDNVEEPLYKKLREQQ